MVANTPSTKPVALNANGIAKTPELIEAFKKWVNVSPALDKKKNNPHKKMNIDGLVDSR